MAGLGNCKTCNKKLNKGFFTDLSDYPSKPDPSQCQGCYRREEHERFLMSKEDGSPVVETQPVSMPESSSGAIGFVSGVNVFILIVGLVIAAVTSILGIFSQTGMLILAGFFMALISIFIYAIDRIFIGIAQDIKAIRQKLLGD